MMNRLFDSCTPDSSDPTTDGDNQTKKQWRLLVENYSVSRRALFTAKAQLS